jgi:hypothetical protein
MMRNLPRITFGMIVLNGEPFILYNLRSIYPFAHEIIVVEGAVPGSASNATIDGHSNDGTLASISYFKQWEDPEDKLILVTAEDEGYTNGFWPGEKDEQSRAFACRATGDYLWQVDADEFYKESDMCTIIKMLRAKPETTAMSFKQITFWGGFDFVADGFYLRRGAEMFHRLFRWGNGYQYLTHRPPTVLDSQGKNVRSIVWADGNLTSSLGVYLYHYSLLFPKQVIEKMRYYAKMPWGDYSKGAIQWAYNNFLNHCKYPFQAHNVHIYASWIRRFHGRHPEQIEKMKNDFKSGKLKIEVRNNSDIDHLIELRSYLVCRKILSALACFSRYRYFPMRTLSKIFLQIQYDSSDKKLKLG